MTETMDTALDLPTLAREVIEAGKKATAGPWEISRYSLAVVAAPDGRAVVKTPSSYDGPARAANAAFIALSREAPRLAEWALAMEAEIARLRAERDEAVATMSRMCGDA